MNAATILAELERNTPTGELPDLIAACAGTQARALARLTTPQATPIADDIVDVADLAVELQLTPSWLLSQARRNKLPHLRCGKFIKFRRAEVMAVIARAGTDHRMGSPESAEKTNNGAALFPTVSKRSPRKAPPLPPTLPADADQKGTT